MCIKTRGPNQSWGNEKRVFISIFRLMPASCASSEPRPVNIVDFIVIIFSIFSLFKYYLAWTKGGMKKKTIAVSLLYCADCIIRITGLHTMLLLLLWLLLQLKWLLFCEKALACVCMYIFYVKPCCQELLTCVQIHTAYSLRIRD